VKILHVNKFAYSKGGAEEYMLRLAGRQQASGHDVTIFGSTNTRTSHSTVPIVNYDVLDFHSVKISSKGRAVREVMWSKRAAAAIRAVLNHLRPDVVHLHNYAHQMSSSILPEIAQSGARSVYTAHDYKLICPAYVANRKGADCFSCSRQLSPRVLVDRCHHDSLMWSTLVVAESLLVRSRGLVPDVIVAPSTFMLESLRQSWIGGSSLHMVRNPAETAGISWSRGKSLLYVGRLSREKGVSDLLRACADAGLHLDIAGDGPLRSELESYADPRLVTFHGHVGQDRLNELRSRCIAQVVPSQWPENAPLSVLECLVDGIPVIATDRGGLPELQGLSDSVSLVSEISASSLLKSISHLENTAPDLSQIRSQLSWDRHLQILSKIYGVDE